MRSLPGPDAPVSRVQGNAQRCSVRRPTLRGAFHLWLSIAARPAPAARANRPPRPQNRVRVLFDAPPTLLSLSYGHVPEQPAEHREARTGRRP